MLLKILWIVLAVINLAAFVVCGADKAAARKQAWRVPEKVLFLLAAVGGSLGMYLGMLTFRHKTRHWYFMLGIPAILVLQVGLAFFLMRMFG